MKRAVWLTIVLSSSYASHAAIALFDKASQTNSTDYDYEKDLDGDEDDLIMEEEICGRCDCSNLTSPYIILDCSSVSLTSLPTWLSTIAYNATHIDLDLSSNCLDHVDALPPLPLWSLDLSRNNISTLEPLAFSNVGSSLLYLDLSHNQLTGLSINSTTFQVKHNNSDPTSSQAALRELNLSDNLLNSLTPTTFSSLINLQNLDLSDNPLGDLTHDTAEAVKSIVMLQTLKLRNVGLKQLPDNFFIGLNQLAHLDLSCNGLDVVPPQLMKASSLSSLQMDNNNLLSLEADSFIGLINLHTLSVSNNLALRKINTGALTPLVSLEKLRIENNPALSWISPGAWDMYSTKFNLKELFLANNNLKYLPIQLLPDFSNWRDLDVADLQGNPWWCDCHNDFVINTLVPMIHDKTPELTSKITCAGPPSYHLVKEELMVVHAMTPAADLPCDKDRESFDPWEPNFGIHPRHEEWLAASEARLNSQLPTVLVVLCVLSVAATAILVGVLYARQGKRRPAGTVRFSRGGPKAAGARVTRYSRPGATGVDNTEYRDDESNQADTKQVRTVRQWPPQEDKIPDLHL